uniref:Uncharacterized protein n=1 Tax=Candidatus Kentrum sp. FW TaxID=2126338 RepID=A0A450TRB9_9GAMM|nr:MAG: hypothetical protein BECKFW1821C_GA0114237_10247 [Candidatus Kentron sp. FW]
MLNEATRRAAIQHITNTTGLMQQIEEELQQLAELLEIEVEFVPFDDDFPDPSLTGDSPGEG